MMEEKITFTSNLRKMFPTVLGCFNEDLQVKVKNWADLDYLKSSGNNLGLLNDIKQ